MKVVRMMVVSLFLLAGVMYGADNRPATPPARVLHLIQYPGAVQTFASGINNDRDVVGMYQLDEQGPIHAFLRESNGRYFNIDKPGAFSTWVTGMNNFGEIVGYFVDRDPRTCVFDCGSHGFVRWDERHYQNIEPPGGVQASIVTGINNHRQLLGRDNLRREFIWEKGQFTFLANIPAGLNLWSFNDKNQFVGDGIGNANGGFDAAIFQGSAFTRIAFPADIFTRAFGINDSGEVAGFAIINDSGPIGFVFRDGKFETTFQASPFVTQPQGINNRGDVVGNTGDGAVSTGFVLLVKDDDDRDHGDHDGDDHHPDSHRD